MGSQVHLGVSSFSLLESCVDSRNWLDLEQVNAVVDPM